MSVADHINDLKSRPSARDAYNLAMDYPKKMIEKRFSELTLDNRPVVVHDYASKWCRSDP